MITRHVKLELEAQLILGQNFGFGCPCRYWAMLFSIWALGDLAHPSKRNYNPLNGVERKTCIFLHAEITQRIDAIQLALSQMCTHPAMYYLQVDYKLCAQTFLGTLLYSFGNIFKILSHAE